MIKAIIGAKEEEDNLVNVWGVETKEQIKSHIGTTATSVACESRMLLGTSSNYSKTKWY